MDGRGAAFESSTCIFPHRRMSQALLIASFLIAFAVTARADCCYRSVYSGLLSDSENNKVMRRHINKRDRPLIDTPSPGLTVNSIVISFPFFFSGRLAAGPDTVLEGGPPARASTRCAALIATGKETTVDTDRATSSAATATAAAGGPEEMTGELTSCCTQHLLVSSAVIVHALCSPRS